MNEKEIMDIENNVMAQTFAKRELTITKGKGALVWDINGNQYIDCTGSYGVAIVGHCHPKVVAAVQKQVETLIACHASFYNDTRSELLQKLISIAPKGLDRVFLSSSGAESVECALKLARKKTGKTEIISMMGAFHGKTMGALSATWKKKYRAPFMPLVPGFKHVPANNLEKVKEAITDKTAAIIAEPVRGEGGILMNSDDFLPGLREICDEKNVLLIFDEVQTGFGRTGKVFACEHYNVVPDIMCLAKSVAGGLPMAATFAKEEVMAAFNKGEHSSTFSGNPLVCAAASAAIDVLKEEKLAERAATLGSYFKGKLEALAEKYNTVREIRGLGLMIGMEMRFDVYSIIMECMNNGVLVLDAGRNVVRFLPPLVIKKEQIDQVVTTLDCALEKENK
ncbi:MAG: aspartate aminotransferase family protein [Candidatus Bathyarchaeota archaeon]|nr:aspartate aminotransferase family protein [Candidatus Bathyarchaeota archaeon]